nr:hypothetical protein CFP56_77234 [Quercus suber]
MMFVSSLLLKVMLGFRGYHVYSLACGVFVQGFWETVFTGCVVEIQSNSMASKKKTVTVPGYFSMRKVNNKAEQDAQSRAEEIPTQQNQTEKLFVSVHEPTGEPMGAERYK